ncbi:helix-turn-helix domain-containing protein [Pediococcus argentinicus]|uniref:HTH cro/C1-type domain-containing protein n=1 Tax=Pediococcus argentinicus TaxID=480391 RepID=A0A0R2N8E6_9LACO|nr:helix-turn-helix domain-containing protein [Pediococcus argentinicus]KRO22111.1 hypothetical protein IV88_GL001300 [Pediococcus argentinicus]NKZ22462.1 helix-turn-helix domain-containing protein [Pediococcus argentinicus]GEP20210.1 AbrB family transcriptional regulator [Pediococcus argentinicus]
MKNQKNVIANNLRFLRSQKKWSKEYLAEKLDVTRQSIAKWENGESLPDLINCVALSELYGVDLNNLVRYDADKEGMPIGPANKHIFGTVKVGDRGQIVLPKNARDMLEIKAGDNLMVLGDSGQESPGLALISTTTFMKMTGQKLDNFFFNKDE